jgi:hypothetical protein
MPLVVLGLVVSERGAEEAVGPFLGEWSGLGEVDRNGLDRRQVGERCLMTAANQPDRSPAPGIIPEPVYVTGDTAPPTAPTEKRDEPKLGRRNPLGSAIAKVASAFRGDKYMVGAYPAAKDEDAAARGASSVGRER